MLTDSLPARLDWLHGEIATACERSGRSPEEVTLVAVSKTVDRPVIDRAYGLGVRHFGENRVQRAASIFADAVPDDLVLHLVGQLQTNKARLAVSLFDLVESVDRESLISALEQEGVRQNATIPILLQVNVAREVQKAGCDPDDAVRLCRAIADCDRLDLRGLMTIAPLAEDPETVRPVFRDLRRLRERIEHQVPGCVVPILSMGMTNDFAVAVEEGATHIRVGRAIFGD